MQSSFFAFSIQAIAGYMIGMAIGSKVKVVVGPYDNFTKIWQVFSDS